MSPAARDVRRRELGGPDPLDRRLGVPRPTPLSRLWVIASTRSALGLSPSPTPAVVFLPVGFLLGPRALGLLSTSVLSNLDPAVTIALTVLGMLVGTALGRDVWSEPRILATASLESLVTIAGVAGATLYFSDRTAVPLGTAALPLALALGLCASASSATSADPDSEPAAAVATRVADLDDVLPILLATCVVLPGATSDLLWPLLVAPIFIGAAAGALGWLLFERADSGGERAVFVLGTLGLAGGAAAYVHVSPLTVGLIAGFLWTLSPGRADRIAQEDLGRVQHPLVVLLLVVAGAWWTPAAAGIWLLAPYLLFRLAGKVAGAWASASLADVGPADLAAYLMPPGVLAVAFALNFHQLLPSGAGTILLSTVAVGTAIFELFSLAIVPRWRGIVKPAGAGPGPRASGEEDASRGAGGGGP
jgi:hypothetical protein